MKTSFIKTPELTLDSSDKRLFWCMGKKKVSAVMVLSLDSIHSCVIVTEAGEIACSMIFSLFEPFRDAVRGGELKTIAMS